MKISKSIWFKTMVAGAMTAGIIGLAAAADAENYAGTAYIAGMGGHFA